MTSPTNANDEEHMSILSDVSIFAELNEMLVRRLAENGGSGVEVRVIPMLTEIIIHATQTQNVLYKQGRRELAARVQKRATVIQASWRICCSENLLWCPEFCYEKRGESTSVCCE